MLATILTIHHSHIETLAESWLASGAKAYAIWTKGFPFISWPANAASDAPSLVESIVVGNRSIGELRVVGVCSKGAQDRLKAEAGLISDLARLTSNLDTVTGELIDTQDQLLAIYDLTRATRSQFDLGEVMNLLSIRASRLVKAEGAFLRLLLPGQQPISKHYPSPMVDSKMLEQFLNIMRETGQEFLMDREQTAGQSLGFRNLLLTPILIRDSFMAVLGLLNKSGGDFRTPDIKLARAIAEHAGTRIESVLLYEKNLEQTRLQTEVELAQRVQLNLLPRQLPQVAGLDLWASSRPARHVGGDFYDFLDRPGRPFAFTVGDVSGKGLASALLMAMTRTVIRTKSNTIPVPSPGTVMVRSNEELYDDFTDVNMFATVFVGQYDSANQELLYANAGHSPVVYCPVGGRARLLPADSTPIGILPTSVSKNQQLNFREGDVLVVATDGLNEAHNLQDETFGYERLLGLIESLVDKSAREIANDLYTAVGEFSAGHAQDDDQTLMVLRNVGA